MIENGEKVVAKLLLNGITETPSESILKNINKFQKEGELYVITYQICKVFHKCNEILIEAVSPVISCL